MSGDCQGQCPAAVSVLMCPCLMYQRLKPAESWLIWGRTETDVSLCRCLVAINKSVSSKQNKSQKHLMFNCEQTWGQMLERSCVFIGPWRNRGDSVLYRLQCWLQPQCEGDGNTVKQLCVDLSPCCELRGGGQIVLLSNVLNMDLK